MSRHQIVNPPEWAPPVGYANGIVSAGGRTLWIAGQVAFDAAGQVVGKGDLVTQFEQVLSNIQAVVSCAGGTLQDLVKMTIYVQDRDDYRRRVKEIGAIYRRFFDRHFPAMALVEIARFYEDDVLVEIESVAVLAG